MTETTTAPSWPDDPFEKALAAEPQLQAIDCMVRVLAANAPKRRTGKPFCSSCIWESILKPLVYPWVGWGRCHLPGQAPAHPPTLDESVLTVADLMDEAEENPPVPPANDTEAWLRSSEAYDAVTDHWLALLDSADPANGHGIHGQFPERGRD